MYQYAEEQMSAAIATAATVAVSAAKSDTSRKYLLTAVVSAAAGFVLARTISTTRR
jgi:general stress protein CsbA